MPSRRLPARGRFTPAMRRAMSCPWRNEASQPAPLRRSGRRPIAPGTTCWWHPAKGPLWQAQKGPHGSTARLTAPISPIPENGVGVLASAENSPARAFWRLTRTCRSPCKEQVKYRSGRHALSLFLGGNARPPLSPADGRGNPLKPRTGAEGPNLCSRTSNGVRRKRVSHLCLIWVFEFGKC